jgi:hypothetical protein
MQYEWDENKRQINLRKHGFDFIVAGCILEDPRSVTVDDVKHSTMTEKRLMTIGLYKEVVCVVIIHTNRNGIVRIISFRHANRKEEMLLWQS